MSGSLLPAGATGGQASGSGQAPPPASPAGTASWRDSLPADLKDNAALSVHPDVGSLVKSYLHAQSLVGADKISVPSQHSTDEDWGKIFDKLGRPQGADKYEIKLPDGLAQDHPHLKSFREAAHKAGLLPKQAQAFLDWMTTSQKTEQANFAATAQAKARENVEGLKKEWGQAYDRELSRADAAAEHFGKELNLKKWLHDTGMGQDPTMLKLLAKVGATLKEDTQNGGGGQGRMGNMTPAEIQLKINTTLGDANHPYNNPNHPNHRAAVDEISGYFKALNPPPS